MYIKVLTLLNLDTNLIWNLTMIHLEKFQKKIMPISRYDSLKVISVSCSNRNPIYNFTLWFTITFSFNLFKTTTCHRIPALKFWILSAPGRSQATTGQRLLKGNQRRWQRAQGQVLIFETGWSSSELLRLYTASKNLLSFFIKIKDPRDTARTLLNFFTKGFRQGSQWLT